MNYKVSITYGDLGTEPVITGELTADQVAEGVNAFLRDMLRLPGSVVQRITIERETS